MRCVDSRRKVGIAVAARCSFLATASSCIHARSSCGRATVLDEGRAVRMDFRAPHPLMHPSHPGHPYYYPGILGHQMLAPFFLFLCATVTVRTTEINSARIAEMGYFVIYCRLFAQREFYIKRATASKFLSGGYKSTHSVS